MDANLEVDVNIENSISANAIVKEEKQELKINEESTIDVPNPLVDVGIEIKAKSGYRIEKANYKNKYGRKDNLKISDNGKKATTNDDMSDKTIDVTVKKSDDGGSDNGGSDNDLTRYEVTIKPDVKSSIKANIRNGNDQHDLHIDQKNVLHLDKNKEIKIKIEASTNYLITGGKYKDKYGRYKDMDIGATKATDYEPKDKTVDLQIETKKIRDNGGSENSFFEGVTGFNHVYAVTNDNLIALGKQTYKLGDDTGGNYNPTDFRDFIINIINLPFPIDDESKSNEPTRIVLGGKLLDERATPIMVDMYNLDIGTIEIPEKYGNTYDYMNTDVSLILPYVEPITLNVNDVVGKTITINYEIDMYNADTTINIRDKESDRLIHTESVTIGREIPFLEAGKRQVNELSRFKGNRNKVQKAYVEIVRNIPVNDNQFDDIVKDYSKLNDVEGFISVNEINLKVNASLNEKQEIEQLLQDGIIIK